MNRISDFYDFQWGMNYYSVRLKVEILSEQVPFQSIKFYCWLLNNYMRQGIASMMVNVT